MAFDMSDYVTVPERVTAFYEQYPEGRIVSDPPKIVTIGDRTFIEVTTRVYRTPDDPTPCQGSAWEPFPGRTPYTKESEMMNAETSAVGRACAAAGVAVRKSMASANEVAARRIDRNATPGNTSTGRPARASNGTTAAAPATNTAEDALAKALIQRMGELPETLRKRCKTEFINKFGSPGDLTMDQLVAADQFVLDYENKARSAG